MKVITIRMMTYDLPFSGLLGDNNHTK